MSSEQEIRDRVAIMLGPQSNVDPDYPLVSVRDTAMLLAALDDARKNVRDLQAAITSPELPTCARCSQVIERGSGYVLADDGRPAHPSCRPAARTVSQELPQEHQHPHEEKINHPAHYRPGKHEAIDVIEEWGLGFCLGNCVKYIARHELKGTPVEDLEKANWYLRHAITKLLEKKS